MNKSKYQQCFHCFIVCTLGPLLNITLLLLLLHYYYIIKYFSELYSKQKD